MNIHVLMWFQDAFYDQEEEKRKHQWKNVP